MENCRSHKQEFRSCHHIIRRNMQQLTTLQTFQIGLENLSLRLRLREAGCQLCNVRDVSFCFVLKMAKLLTFGLRGCIYSCLSVEKSYSKNEWKVLGLHVQRQFGMDAKTRVWP